MNSTDTSTVLDDRQLAEQYRNLVAEAQRACPPGEAGRTGSAEAHGRPGGGQGQVGSQARCWCAAMPASWSFAPLVASSLTCTQARIALSSSTWSLTGCVLPRSGASGRGGSPNIFWSQRVGDPMSCLLTGVCILPTGGLAIRQAVLDRAGNCCEGLPAYPTCRAANGRPHPVTRSKVVLTVAHLDHDTTNNRPENLRAWCQRCHLTYDAEHHAANRRKTSAAAQGTQACAGKSKEASREGWG